MQKKESEIYCSKDRLVSFGSDIVIKNKSNFDRSSFSSFGDSYELPNNFV